MLSRVARAYASLVMSTRRLMGRPQRSTGKRRTRGSRPSGTRTVGRPAQVAVEIRPTRRAALNGELAAVLIVQDEAKYLPEWFEFHRLAGIEHVFVYDNLSTDDTWAVLRAHEESGFVTPLPWDLPFSIARQHRETTAGAQRLAYAHAVTTFGRNWRWMAFLDADEFLFPVSGDDLRLTLASYQDLPGIGDFGSMFGSMGNRTDPDGPVIENFTRRAPFPMAYHMKSIVDPRMVERVSTVHKLVSPIFDEQHRLIAGFDKRLHRGAGASGLGYIPTSDVFRLHHYVTKSMNGTQVKSLRHTFRTKSVLQLAALVEKHATIDDLSALRFRERRRQVDEM